jgi:3-oxoacyl-[acyl-carrier-protein] synthase II
MDDSGEEPARAMTLAIKESQIDPGEVDYLNYHGTSTDMNDRIETRAVKLAFGKHAWKLAGSATKSMIGHPQGACGAAGVAATLMAFRDDIIPPTINLDEPDPECDLDYVPDVGRRGRVNAAVCNTIAFGSKNSALVLKRY